MNKLNKRDLMEIVAEKGHLSKRDAKVAVTIAFDEILKALLNGTEVNISNFGAFEVKKRREREGTHPKNHTPLTIEGKNVVSFRASKSLKEKINR
jgi:nucleoid DNA-binding protein